MLRVPAFQIGVHLSLALAQEPTSSGRKRHFVGACIVEKTVGLSRDSSMLSLLFVVLSCHAGSRCDLATRARSKLCTPVSEPRLYLLTLAVSS